MSTSPREVDAQAGRRGGKAEFPSRFYFSGIVGVGENLRFASFAMAHIGTIAQSSEPDLCLQRTLRFPMFRL